MAERRQLVVFRLDQQKYAVDLTAVERVLPAVEIRPLPEAPAIVAGIINLHGRIIPVISIRQRLALTERDLGLTDQLLVVRSATRTLALIVDGVEEVAAIAPDNWVAANAIFPGIGLVEGVLRLDDGLIVIFDLDQFFSLPDDQALAQALDQHEKTL